MEKLKIKHDHKLTDILKVGIFCLFLILPILLFLPNCLYYGFNEHATNSETTTINYKYQSNEVNTLNDLVEGNIYYIDELPINDYSYITNHFDIQFYCLQAHLVLDGSQLDEFLLDEIYTELYNVGPFDINITGGDNYVTNTYIKFGTEDFYASYIIEDTSLTLSDLIFSFVNNETNSLQILLTDLDILPEYTDYNVIESVEVNTDDTITTQIGNSWASLWQTPFLQWTDNNNFQFTINAFTNVFGITQESYITNYLNYILTMTCIYLVFDIVISISTKLTHMLTNSKE